jgi:hypothetical protein
MKGGWSNSLCLHVMRFILLLITALTVTVSALTITPSPYWKNQILFPDDQFQSRGSDATDIGWVKFTILLNPYDPNIVYFQDCSEYLFHYDFATELLDPFIGMTVNEYNNVTLFEYGQQAILGTVLFPPVWGEPPAAAYPEYGIQFIRQSPYSREEIASLFNIVSNNVIADISVTPLYFPTYEQLATAEANRDWFESQGILIGTTSRWSEGNICYSEGWALGRLKYFSGDQIENAYLTGELLPDDILLTDGVPAEIPFVAGIMCLWPSTPNSHVAILAQTYSVPFAHIALPEDAAEIQNLIDRTIYLSAFNDDYGVGDIEFIDLTDILASTTIEEILELKLPPLLNISPMANYGSYYCTTDNLLPDDIQYFGGKAANFGILRTSIPDNSPLSLAFSFDLWNEFLDQTLTNSKSLRDEIADRLSEYTTYPPADMAALSYDLEVIRENLFKNTYATTFSPQLQDAIINALTDPQFGFDPNRKIRFRSSTNVEDGEQFTGAGLYDSYSGCLADDLDGNTYGPCLCDPTENNERGVFRAIRKVFAAFYNYNAFLERLRHRVDETEVGMALLVHHSFPDEIEMANGVATLRKRTDSSYRFIELVTQFGAFSVTNPEDGSVPEEVSVTITTNGDVLPALIQYSNLVPLGETVMDWQDDYIELSQLIKAVGDRFSEVTGKADYLLDLEYKKIAPEGNLLIKQVRQIPEPDKVLSVTPFLINQPGSFEVFSGEFQLGEPVDVFADHRLKSQWLLETEFTWLEPNNLSLQSFYEHAEIEYSDTGRINKLTGILPEWPFAYHDFDGTIANDNWVMHHLPNPQHCRLSTTNIPTLISQAQSPLYKISDLGRMAFNLDYKCLTFEVTYNKPVRSWNQYFESPAATISNTVHLWSPPSPGPDDILQERFMIGSTGELILTSFYIPPPPEGYGDWTVHTAPLKRWVETYIEGYTSEPIILHGYYSQTYRPEHHNMIEHYLFEPRLEPGLSQNILDELQAQDIRLIHMILNNQGGSSSITTYGFDFVPADFDDNDSVNLSDLAAFAEQWDKVNCGLCAGADLTGDENVDIQDLTAFTTLWLGGDGPHLAGDVNKDKTVNITDLAALAANWLDTVCDTCQGADLTGDGCVRIDDLAVLAENWSSDI